VKQHHYFTNVRDKFRPFLAKIDIFVNILREIFLSGQPEATQGHSTAHAQKRHTTVASGTRLILLLYGAAICQAKEFVTRFVSRWQLSLSQSGQY
jgi:hypothetical protein